MSWSSWVLILLPVAAGSAVAQRAEPGYAPVYEQLRQLAPRTDRVATVRDLVLRRDAAELRLRDGTLYLLTPVGDRTVGAVFNGTGSLVFRAPLAQERAHMQRVLGDSVLDVPITAAVLLFADSTLTELERSVSFANRTAPAPGGDHGDRVKDALAFIHDARLRMVDDALMTAVLNATSNGYFGAYVKRARGEDLFFKVDPHEVEEVQLLRRGRRQGQRVETVCQFQRADDLRDGVAVVDERPMPLYLESYKLDATIAANLDFRADATVRLIARDDGGRWARFLLFHELEVDSVFDERGAPATYFRHKGSPELWVRFDPPFTVGESHSVRIAYHGELLAKGSLINMFLPGRLNPVRLRELGPLDRWTFIKSTALWFPRYSEWQAADMEMTFHTPEKHRFSSIGRLAESRVERGVRHTRWVTEVPTQQASFNIGEFSEFQITDPRIPPVTVHINTDAHKHLDQLFMQQQDPEQQVGGDIVNSLSFFIGKFGPPLFRHYYATEIPYFHGQAFPGLIHLSWVTFQSTSESGFDESFRAHEMAHQWWGIGVEPADYRDAWLSEGFAEFAGLWYMQLILGSNEKYFQHLRDARDAIRETGRNAPPIALGYRAGQHDPRDYFPIVYQKGAWVLHMLRNMMIDFSTMNEEPFTAMLQDFYTKHRGGRATTADFQAIVEKHTGLPMDWFFEQWVRGTAIPTYIVSWRSEPAADGKHRLHIRVRQEDVAPDFVMPLPIAIHFPDSGRTVARVNVRGSVTNAELLLPAEPKRLEANLLESVLAVMKTETWR